MRYSIVICPWRASIIIGGKRVCDFQKINLFLCPSKHTVNKRSEAPKFQIQNFQAPMFISNFSMCKCVASILFIVNLTKLIIQPNYFTEDWFGSPRCEEQKLETTKKIYSKVKEPQILLKKIKGPLEVHRDPSLREIMNTRLPTSLGELHYSIINCMKNL